MPQLVYGVWNNQVFDNRKGTQPQTPVGLNLDIFAHFNPNNPAQILFGSSGFLVLSPDAPLLWGMWKHFEQVAADSCGKCSPCRAGAPLLRDSLAAACRGETYNLQEIQAIAEQMTFTSLCGIGRTGAIALLAALTHFLDEFKLSSNITQGVYSATTSPCIEACPGLVNVPRYIDYIKDGHNDLAANTVLRSYPLVGSCGRVCVRTCEAVCLRNKVDEAVAIRSLKRFAADKAIASGMLKAQGTKTVKDAKVAVIGAGPVGITCAYHLLERGYAVDIFEAKPASGGMIRYGIPIYRLPKFTLEKECDIVAEMGGKFHYNQKLGKDFNVDDLFARNYKAVFISGGCPSGSYLSMPEEDISLPGYENGIDFLERVYEAVEKDQAPTLHGDIVVVGGGNVAMDCCRAAVRLATGKVHLVYRRTQADAPAEHDEIVEAQREGVQFHFLCGQDSLVVENGTITGLKVQQMEQSEPDASGRRSVKPIPNSHWVLPCSRVIAAIGQNTDPTTLQPKEGIDRDKKQYIIISSGQETSRPGVFAGGDCTAGPRANGPTTMIMGMGQAYFAARSIDQYLAGEIPFDSRWRMSEWIMEGKLMDDVNPIPRRKKRPRVPLRELAPEERVGNFREVELTMTQEDAWAEASRCMRCYRIFTVITQQPIPA